MSAQASNTKIAILDSHLITEEFSGGGLINAHTLLVPLAKYKILYLPKTVSLFKNRYNYDKIFTNLEKLKKIGFAIPESIEHVIFNASNKNIVSSLSRRLLLDLYIQEIRSKHIKLVYDNDFFTEYSPTSNFIPDILKLCMNLPDVNFGITLRGYSLINIHNSMQLIKTLLKFEPNYLFKRDILKRFASFLMHPLLDKIVNIYARKCDNLKFIAVVNPVLSIWNSDMSKRKDKFQFLFPSDIAQFTVEEEFLPQKDPARIFFYGRLVPEKGIFDIPFILLELKKYKTNFKLHIAGRFFLKEDEITFFNLLRRYNLIDHVKYMGFLNDTELKNELLKAKVLLYPSYSDSFSIAVLNSLHLKTKVVAYGIPTLKAIYGKIPAVTFVKEHDVKGMALAVSKILDENDEKYFQSFSDLETKIFLQKTGDPNELLNALLQIISKYL